MFIDKNDRLFVDILTGEQKKKIINFNINLSRSKIDKLNFWFGSVFI